MELKFISRVRKGNKGGTGFLSIPRDKSTLFNLNDKAQIKLIDNVCFFAQIIEYSHKLGVYVPKSLMEKYGLLNKEVRAQMRKIKGFYAPVASDGRIYIPDDVVKNNSLHNNDIISIKVIENNKIIQEEYVKIYVAQRPDRNKEEFICYVDKNFSGKTLVFQIKKLPSAPRNKKLSPLVVRLLQDTHYAFINESSVIIFRGNKVSAIINTKIKLSDITFYLGAYFADGTKQGNSWAISASTFDQARYYLKMHNSLIKDSKPEFTISYTNIHNIDNSYLKKKLARIWESKAGIKVDKFRIRKPTGRLISKWNKYGTLVIREHRQILLDVYNTLLNSLIKEILFKKDKKLAIDFLCGVMEGDGCAPATKRGHIMIFTNKDDIQPLEKIFKAAQIKFRINKEDENKYSFRIGALEILRNFHLLNDKLFILYSKRRKIFFERLKTVGAVKFLLENHGSTNWVKALLRNYGFCDRNYQLTTKGLKLRNELITINNTIA